MINKIEELIEDLKQGKMVILVDDEDRENEGDLVVAAEFISPEHINFMAKFGRGLVCLTLTEEKCKKLKLRSVDQMRHWQEALKEYLQVYYDQFSIS